MPRTDPTPENVLATLNHHLAPLTPPSVTTTLETMGMDSLDQIELAMACEEAFGVEFNTDVLERNFTEDATAITVAAAIAKLRECGE